MRYPNHAKLDSFAVGIHIYNLDHNLLVNGYDFRRVGNISFGQLGEVYKPVLLDAYIDESSEIGNIAYDARQNHAFAQVCDGAHVLVEFKYLDRFTRVATRLVEFLHDVLQGRQAHSRRDVVRYLDFLAEFLIRDQFVYATFQVLCHLLYDVVAFRMHGGMIQRIFSSGDAKKSCALQK